jgi:hypothetical protein
MAAVRQGCGEALGQTNLEVDTTRQNRAEVGRQTAAGEIGTDATAWDRWKTKLLWGRIHVGQGGVRVVICVSR